MLVNIIQNTISSFISAGISVITTNLKMWLGFETSETLGREEVVNGDFSDGTTSWSEEGNSTISVGTYEGKTDVANINITDALSNSRIEQAFNYVNGKTYQVSVEVYLVSGSFRADSRDGFVPVNFVSTTTTGSWQTLTGTITAIQTGTDVVWLRSDEEISQFYVNSISIKELTQITPDKSGNNNVGELFTGKALEFDGATEYVDIDFTTQIKSAVFWVKPLDTGVQSILGFGGAFSGSKYIKSVNNNIQSAGLSSVSVYVNGVSTTSVPVNQWSRVVVNFALLTPQELTFGYGFDTYGYIELSDVQLYDENLSADDIAYDYANPNKLAIDNPSTSLNVTNLKGYWALSEGDGLVAYDSGTNLEEDVVLNGDFALDSNWSEGAGWDIDTANNKITRTAQSQSTSATQNISFVSGKSYSITYTLDVSAGSFLIRLGGVGILDTPARSVSDTYTEVITATANHTIFNLRALNGTFAGSISNVSVRELTASDHGGLIVGADYVLNQPRIPQLGMQNWSKGSNSLIFSEDFSNAVWTKGTGTSVVGGFTDPLGGNTAYKASYDGVGSQPYIFDDLNNITNMRSVWARTVSGTGQIHLTSHNSNSNSLFNLTTVWQRVSAIPTSGAGVANYYLVDFRGSTDLTEVLVWGAQIDDGTTLGAYRLTDGGATLNSTVIPNPTIPTQDIFGNLVRDRLNSFNLDGSGYAEVADADDLDFGTGDFTIECWAKFDFENKGSTWNSIVSLGDNIVSTTSAGLATKVGKFYFNIGGTTIIGSTPVLVVGDWYHVVGTRTGTTMRLYINTALESITATSAQTVTNTGSKIIGDDAAADKRAYENLISDVRLYSVALSATEIENNYNAGLSAHTN